MGWLCMTPTGVAVEWCVAGLLHRIIIKVRRCPCLCPCGWSDLCDGSSSSLVKIEEFYDNEDL